jgi:hypothetical protein
MNRLRIIALIYALLFVIVAGLNYIPGVRDAQGRTFGLFELDIFDDALHLASGLWAAIAALWSTRATIIFFRVFGTLYCFDGLLGLLTGSGYLDLGIILQGIQRIPFVPRLLLNLPHIVIGGFAAFTGFVLAPRVAPGDATR